MQFPIQLAVCVALVLGFLQTCGFTHAQQLSRAIGPPPGDLEAKDGEPPLAPVLRWGEAGVEALEQVTDYTARLIKRERIQGRLEQSKLMFVKVRHQPLSVYVRFETTTGRVTQEIVYIAGRNRGRMSVHSQRRKILGTMSVYPRSRIALREGRYPITDIGLLFLTKQLVKHARATLELNNSQVQIYPNATIDGRPTLALTVTHAQPHKKLAYHHARVFIDREWNVPVRYEAYDFPRSEGEPPRLLEQYTYSDLQFNVGLTDADFDIRNPEYHFPIHETDDPPASPKSPSSKANEAPAWPDVPPQSAAPTEPVRPSTVAAQFTQAAATATKRLAESPAYTCLVIRRHVVDGRLNQGEFYRLKMRRQPMGIYARGLWPPHVQQRRFLYAPGTDGGNVVSRLSTHRAAEYLTPRALQKRLNDRRPISEIGIQTLLAGAVDGINHHDEASSVRVRRYSNAHVDSRACVCYEVSAADRNVVSRRIFFDKRYKIPIRFEWFDPPTEQGGPPSLVEAVTFRDVALNAKLSARDFDAANPAYGFLVTPVATAVISGP